MHSPSAPWSRSRAKAFSRPRPEHRARFGGTWLIVDAGLLTVNAITLNGNGATIRDLGIWHEQAAVARGWRPRAFGYAINMGVPDTLVRHVWLANPTLGIHGIGRVTIENVTGQPIEVGIKIDTAYDVVRLRQIKFNWTADGTKYWSTSSLVKRYMLAGIDSERNDNPEMNDIRVAGYRTGIHFGANSAGPTSKFSMMDTYVNDANDCVLIDGANTTGKLDRLWARNCRDVGIRIDGANNVITGADIDIDNVGANGIRVGGANAQMLVNQVGVSNYDHAGAGFPAIEAAAVNATVKIGLFHNFSGGSVGAGGVGRVMLDTNGANAAFDLRIPTPTKVPEESVFPFAAKVSVMKHGAKGDGVTDDTAAIQAALDAAAAGGFKNVLVPAGNYHMRGGVKVPAGVTLIGIGWSTGPAVDQATGIPVAANAPIRGAFFHVDAANTKDIVTLGDHSAIQGIGFKWNQGTVAAGWVPKDFGWGVRVTGTDVKVRDVFMLDPTRGIAVTSAGTGKVLIDRVFGSPATIVSTSTPTRPCASTTSTTGRSTGWRAPSGKVYRAYVEAHATGIRSAHSAHAEVSNFFTITYQVGLELGKNPAGKVSTDFRLWNTDQDIGVRGYVVSGPGTTANFANWSAQGDNAGPFGVTGLWIAPSATNTHLHGYNGDLRIFPPATRFAVTPAALIFASISCAARRGNRRDRSRSSRAEPPVQSSGRTAYST